MVMDLKKISEEGMLRHWALAETASIRRWKYLENMLPQKILDKVRVDDFDFTNGEWQKLVLMIRSFRSPLLDGLLLLQFEWYEGVIPVNELDQLEMMNWPPFAGLAGSRKLVDLALAFQEGKMPPGHHEFAENLDWLRSDFQIDKMKGRPILVGKSNEPPYMLVEGFTRMSALLLNLLEGNTMSEDMPIVLGTSRRIGEWAFASHRKAISISPTLPPLRFKEYGGALAVDGGGVSGMMMPWPSRLLTGAYLAGSSLKLRNISLVTW